VKLALLMALGSLDAHRAATHLATAGPSLREALAALPPS
jgi:N-acetylmuramic acid 6-phosphate (MurNAc-6-P) etherase